MLGSKAFKLKKKSHSFHRSQCKLLTDIIVFVQFALTYMKCLINIKFRLRMSCWRGKNQGIYCQSEALEEGKEKQCHWGWHLTYNHFQNARSPGKAGPGQDLCPEGLLWPLQSVCLRCAPLWARSGLVVASCPLLWPEPGPGPVACWLHSGPGSLSLSLISPGNREQRHTRSLKTTCPGKILFFF